MPDTLDAYLTPHQLAIVDLVAAGYSNAQIAAQLHVKLPTVKNQMRYILYRTGLCSRFELALVAWHEGRVDMTAKLAELAERRERCAEQSKYEW